MVQEINRQVRLKSRPADIPEAEDFEIVEAPVPEIGDNEVLVRNIYLSAEPAMRGWVSEVANYSEPVGLGTVMRAFAVGRVAASRHSDFRPGGHSRRHRAGPRFNRRPLPRRKFRQASYPDRTG